MDCVIEESETELIEEISIYDSVKSIAQANIQETSYSQISNQRPLSNSKLSDQQRSSNSYLSNVKLTKHRLTSEQLNNQKQPTKERLTKPQSSNEQLSYRLQNNFKSSSNSLTSPQVPDTLFQIHKREQEFEDEENTGEESSYESDSDDEKIKSTQIKEVVDQCSDQRGDRNTTKSITIQNLSENDLEVVEIHCEGLPLEDIKLEELRETLIKDVETSALREKLNEMHNSLIELQIENAKLKFGRDNHKEDMENYRKRLLLTLQETKQLLQESYLLEESNAFLKKLKDDLETERTQTHQEMIEKMLLAKKAARLSNDMEMALRHLSRAYENERTHARQVLQRIEDSESFIKKLQLHWDDLIVAVEQKCKEVEEKSKNVSPTRRNIKKEVCFQPLKTPDEEINGVSKKKKKKPIKKL